MIRLALVLFDVLSRILGNQIKFQWLLGLDRLCSLAPIATQSKAHLPWRFATSMALVFLGSLLEAVSKMTFSHSLRSCISKCSFTTP